MCALYHLDEKRLVVMSFEICVILLGILHVTVAIVFFAQVKLITTSLSLSVYLSVVDRFRVRSLANSLLQHNCLKFE